MNHETVLTAETPKPAVLAHRPWAAVILLMLVGLLNYLDRALPAVLAEPIKHDLQLSDTALGVINGVGFLLIYAVASIPLAHMADRGRYSLVVTLSLTLWSAMTAIGAFVANGWQMALSRMGVAVGEAGGMPAAHAYITRHFPKERRTIALSVFNLCLSFGSMSGFVIGGLLGESLGWRGTFLVMGLIGLALAVVTFVALPRGEPSRADGSPHLSVFGFLPLLKKRSMVMILVGSAFVSSAGYTAVAFIPAFLMRSHGFTVAEAGLRFGLAGGVAGGIGLLVLGWAADRLSRRDPRWLIGTAMVMLGGLLPISILSFQIADPALAVAAVAVNYAIPIAYAAPVIAGLHRLAPVELRARVSALLLLSSGILGGFGPLIAGAISDSLTATYGVHALGHALLVIPAGFAIAVVCYAAALTSYRRDLAEED